MRCKEAPKPPNKLKEYASNVRRILHMKCSVLWNYGVVVSLGGRRLAIVYLSYCLSAQTHTI